MTMAGQPETSFADGFGSGGSNNNLNNSGERSNNISENVISNANGRSSELQKLDRQRARKEAAEFQKHATNRSHSPHGFGFNSSSDKDNFDKKNNHTNKNANNPKSRSLSDSLKRSKSTKSSHTITKSTTSTSTAMTTTASADQKFAGIAASKADVDGGIPTSKGKLLPGSMVEIRRVKSEDLTIDSRYPAEFFMLFYT
jgi:hypothetical protein